MLILPENLRPELKKPLGKLHRSFRDVRIGGGVFLITVGDVTTSNALKSGFKPDISIIDNRVQRRSSDEKLEDNATILRSENPPGTITSGLWRTIEHAIRSSTETGERYMIVVDGEEDLAVLPSILLAPPNARILYGQPNEGVVIVEVEKVVKRARELIKNFEEAENGD